MATNDKARNDTTAQSVAQIANQSFDQEFQVNVVEPLVFNSSTESLDRMVQPATDDAVVLLRRIVKLLESQAVTDPRFRQIVTLGAIKASEASVPTELAGTMPVSGTVTSTIGTSLALGSQVPTAGPPYVALGTQNVVPVSGGPVDQRWRVAEDSHISYQLGIRSHLSFS